MKTRPHPRRVAALGLFSRVAGSLVVLIPCLVLAGWISDNETLKRLQPGLVAMNPVTAVSFILAGLSLWLLQNPESKAQYTLAQVLGGVIAVVSVLALGTIVLGQPGVDQLLFRDKLGVGSATPNRMSPTTTLCFILMGLALVLTDAETRKGTRPAQGLAVIAAWIALLALIGYLYGTTSLYQVKAFIPMAVHTAATFILLSSGFLVARADRGLMARVVSDSAGGAMLRRMLFVIVGVPMVLGWLLATAADVNNPTFAFSLFVVVIIAVFTLMTWANAISLDRQEDERDRATAGLHQAHAELETRVQERTADLAKVLAQIGEGIEFLGSSAGEILNSSTQLAENAVHTAAAVMQTTTTVEQLRQTTQVSTEKAQHVAHSAQNVERISQGGKKSTEETGADMMRIQEQMQTIAANMMRLTEQSSAIGEIIATVDDLAQQSNLLAVNAAIEAAKAGEQGKGFAVVAQEVKHLSDQSKQATNQVRTLLNDIRKATGAAVMSTEQGSRAVEAGVMRASETGGSILTLAESISEAAHSAMQIAASSHQQLVGMDQVAEAMGHVKQASAQNVDNARQLEQSARNLNDLGQRLKRLVEQYQIT